AHPHALIILKDNNTRLIIEPDNYGPFCEGSTETWSEPGRPRPGTGSYGTKTGRGRPGSEKTSRTSTDLCPRLLPILRRRRPPCDATNAPPTTIRLSNPRRVVRRGNDFVEEPV